MDSIYVYIVIVFQTLVQIFELRTATLLLEKTVSLLRVVGMILE